MRGLVLINAYPNGEKFLRQGERIGEELHNLGVEVDILRNGEVFSVIDEMGGMDIKAPKKYDFVVYLDKDKYLGKAMQAAGMRLFNNASAIETCDDKVTTYFALQSSGVRLAKIIPAPLCYTPNAKPDSAFLGLVETELGFPLVIKKSYGSFGAGVALVQNRQQLYEKAVEFLYAPHFYQQYIAESCGRDVRVIVIGGKAVAAMERVAKDGEFRSNVELGGEGRRVELAKEYTEAAERVAHMIGLDYCGVDLLETAKGPVVCEVNSNAFFEGLEKTTGINVAKRYAEYIYQTMIANA